MISFHSGFIKILKHEVFLIPKGLWLCWKMTALRLYRKLYISVGSSNF